jgi:hypothetical protein
MPLRTLLCLSLLVTAQTVSAQSAEPAEPGSVRKPPTPVHGETSMTILAGRFEGPSDTDAAGGLEFGLGVGWPAFSMGLRFSLDTLGAGMGLGLGAVLGPRIALGKRVSLEVLGDAGLVHYSVADTDILFASEQNSGSSAVVPSAGLRVGLRRVALGGRSAVSLGVAFRWVQPQTVTYESTSCLLILCSTREETAGYGGTTVGAYLSLTGISRQGAAGQ